MKKLKLGSLVQLKAMIGDLVRLNRIADSKWNDKVGIVTETYTRHNVVFHRIAITQKNGAHIHMSVLENGCTVIK